MYANLRAQRVTVVLLIAFAVLWGLILSPGVRAANLWDGGGANDNWGTPLNWDNDLVPLFPQAITFAGTMRLTPNNNLTSITVSGINFDPGAGAFVVGGNAITLGGDIVNNATATQSINLPLVLSGNRTVSVVDPTGSLSLGGVISGGFGLTKTGDGALTLTGANTYSGPTFVGSATATGGKIVVGASGTLGNGTSALTLGGENTPNLGNLELSGNSATVGSLSVRSDSVTANTITISNGRTLTVNGNVLVGGFTQAGTGTAFNTATVLTVTGAGGTLAAGNGTGGTFIVGNNKNANTGGGDTIAATAMDMSGLSTFTANYGPDGVIGVAAGNTGLGANAPFGTLTLATNNTITAGMLNVGLNNGGGNTGKGRLFLGQTNIINVDSMAVGAGKTQPTTYDPLNPNETGVVRFNAGLVNPTATLRGVAGGDSRISTLIINLGDLYTGSSGTDESAIIDFTGGTVDAKIDTLLVGIGANNTNNGVDSFATLTFNTGTVDATTIGMAREDRVGAVTDGDVTATINVLGTGNLVVGAGGIEMARRTVGTRLSTGNLNIDGTATIGGDVVVVGLGTLALGNVIVNGTLNMQGHQLGTVAAPLNVVTFNTGSTVTNPATIAGKTITIAAGATLTGTPTFAISDGGSLTSSQTINLASGGGLFLNGPATVGVPSQGTVTGDVVANTGSRIQMGSATAPGTLQLANNLTLNNGSTVQFKLSETPGSNHDQLSVGGNLSVSGAVNLEIGSTGLGAQLSNTYTVISYSGTLTGNQSNFNVIGPGSRSTFTVVPTATTPNTVQVNVSGTGPLALIWIGNASNVWDRNGAANWRDPALNPEKFFTLDTVTFNDTSTNLSDVQLVGNLAPGSVTVSANRNYKFAGSGAIVGGGNLTKNMGGTFVVANNNTYTGTTDILAGTVQVGDGGTTGTLGSGVVNNEGTLVFNRSDAHTFSNIINGAGGVVKQGANTLTLAGNSTYTGATDVTAGTVRVTNNGSLGSLTGGPVNIPSGSALDLSGNGTANQLNFGQKQFNVAGTGVNGTGAILNSGVAQQNALQKVTLTGNATFNAVQRFDIRAGQAGGVNVAALDLAGHTLTKIGENQFTLVAVDVTPGDIVVNQGVFATETTTSIPAALKPDMTPYSITINDGATWQFFGTAVNTNQLNVAHQAVVNRATGSFVTIRNNSDDNVRLDSPITMNGNIVFTGVNDTDDGEIELAGNITEVNGPRSLTKNTGPIFSVILTGAANYTGPTTVNDGALKINADNRIADVSKLVLGGAGGTSAPVFNTGGFSEQLSSLNVGAATSTTIDLGAASGVTSNLRFDASANEVWTGTNPLAIVNYEAGTDHIFFGATNTGPTAGLAVSQVRRITIDGQEVSLAANGELILGPYPAALPKGDLNRDSHVNAADIPAMLAALVDLRNFATANNLFASDVAFLGDIDNDGQFSNRDIQPLLNLLISGGGSTAPVPEPATVLLASIGLAAIVARRGRRRR